MLLLLDKEEIGIKKDPPHLSCRKEEVKLDCKNQRKEIHFLVFSFIPTLTHFSEKHNRWIYTSGGTDMAIFVVFSFGMKRNFGMTDCWSVPLGIKWYVIISNTSQCDCAHITLWRWHRSLLSRSRRHWLVNEMHANPPKKVVQQNWLFPVGTRKQ